MVRAAVIVAERDTTSDAACDGAEDGLDRHADGLGSGVTITDLGNVPSHPFGVPVFDDGEQPDFAILDSWDLGRVGGEGDPLSEELSAAMKRIGELTMENEVLRMRVGHAGPLARRRSR